MTPEAMADNINILKFTCFEFLGLFILPCWVLAGLQKRIKRLEQASGIADATGETKT